MKLARFQLLVHLAALAPLAWLAIDALTGNLSANPIQAVTQRTGKYALILLVLSLSCTPIRIVTGWVLVIRWRRPLGVYAFVYAMLHTITFVGLDYGFNLTYIWADVGNKRYIFVGATAFLILLTLAVTSTRGWQKRLGAAWQRLHKWVYLAGGLVVMHYAWALKSDIRQPLVWGTVIGLGLVLRIPVVRRRFITWHGQRRLALNAAHHSQ